MGYSNLPNDNTCNVVILVFPPLTIPQIIMLHLLNGSSDKRILKTERKDKDAKKRSKKRRKVYSSL
jgi:hypothetical protein